MLFTYLVGEAVGRGWPSVTDGQFLEETATSRSWRHVLELKKLRK